MKIAKNLAPFGFTTRGVSWFAFGKAFSESWLMKGLRANGVLFLLKNLVDGTPKW